VSGSTPACIDAEFAEPVGVCNSSSTASNSFLPEETAPFVFCFYFFLKKKEEDEEEEKVTPTKRLMYTAPSNHPPCCATEVVANIYNSRYDKRPGNPHSTSPVKARCLLLLTS
jgi:hypothetical protein